MNDDQNQEITESREVVSSTDGETTRRQTARTRPPVRAGVVARRTIYYVGSIIIALLGLRIVLLLLAANQGAPFVDLIYGVSGMFAWPFYGIFNYQPSYGQSIFEISSVVAIIVYGLITAGLARLFTLTRPGDDVAV